MPTKLLPLFALLVFSACAQAQVYKCNVGGKVVLTDRPCDADKAAEVRTSRESAATADSGTVDSGNPIETGRAACSNAIRTGVSFKDPESVRIGAISGGTTEVFEHADIKLSARRFVAGVNAKNEYGGYAGERAVSCFTSPDGRRVLKVDTASLNSAGLTR